MLAVDYQEGMAMIDERGYSEHAEFFQDVLEIARRHKIMNPEKMRTEYAKVGVGSRRAEMGQIAANFPGLCAPCGFILSRSWSALQDVDATFVGLALTLLWRFSGGGNGMCCRHPRLSSYNVFIPHPLADDLPDAGRGLPRDAAHLDLERQERSEVGL